MIALVRAELHRLRARRLTLIAGLVLLVGLGLLQLAVNASVTPPSAAEVAQNQKYYDDAVKDWETNHAQYEQECQQSGGSEQDCTIPKPSPADYSLEATPFREIGGLITTVSTVFALFASFLVAASLIGAEYGTGALANWLTFVPQRLRVLGAKLIAVVAAGVVAGVAAGAVAVGVGSLLTRIHGGSLAGVGGLAAIAGRGLVLVVVAGLLGFCVALLTRHTAAAIGVLLAVLVGDQVLAAVGSFLEAFAKAAPWLPGKNLTAFLQHGTTYAVPVTTLTADGSSTDFAERTLTFGHSAVYWAVVTVVVVVGTALVFRRRDVT